MTIGYNISTYVAGTFATGAPVTTATPETTNSVGSTFLIGARAFLSGVSFSIADTFDNAYVALGTAQNDTPNGVTSALYYSQNGLGGAGHFWSVNSTNGVPGEFFVLEIVGGLTNVGNIVDQFYGNVGFLGDPTSGPVTPTINNSLCVSFFMNNSGSTITTVPANGFSNLISAVNSSILVKQVVGGLGVVQDPNPSFTPTGGGTAILTASFIPQTVTPVATYYMSSPVEC